MLKPTDLTPNGEFTEEDHECLVNRCTACSKPLIYVVEPEYDLDVGIQMGIPVEILFVSDAVLDMRIVDYDGFWELHRVGTPYALEMRCECGHLYDLVTLARDGSEVLLLTSKSEMVKRPIPKEIVPYLTDKPEEWDKPGDFPKEQLTREETDDFNMEYGGWEE